jgi:hypothetical protein
MSTCDTTLHLTGRRRDRIQVPAPPGPPGPRQPSARPRPSWRCTDLPRQENACLLGRTATHARTATGPSLSGPIGRLALDGASREPQPGNRPPA